MRNRRAFTLIELLIVISIIGVLVTLVAVTIRPIQTKSRDAKRKSDLNLYLSALDLFKTDFKLYPNHTFYLGKNTADLGAAVSSFDLASDMASCQGLSGDGNPTNFAVKPDFVTAETNYDLAILKPGFTATNHFLLCLKYIDRIVVDSTQGSSANGYKFAVSYDYIDTLVSGVMENTNDQDPKTLFNVTVPKRYYLGSGATVRHLDDDSDWQSEDALTASFFTAFAEPRFLVNGKYLYQCNGKVADQDIKRDDRSLTANEPLTFLGGNWIANPNCRNVDSSLDDVQAW
jgi:prepilin-type N-terminal cleavage/methylation domain-containing protein